MTDSSSTHTTRTSLTRYLFDAARYYLGGRRTLIALASIAVVAGLAFNWSWLVAAGIAPVLVAALPCAAMCALGLCMSRMGGRSCAQDAARGEAAPSSSPEDTVPTPPVDDLWPGITAHGHDGVPVTALSHDLQPQALDERRTTDA